MWTYNGKITFLFLLFKPILFDRQTERRKSHKKQRQVQVLLNKYGFVLMKTVLNKCTPNE